MQPHEFWQAFEHSDHLPTAPYQTSFPASLPNGQILLLPIRPLANTNHGIASLILNQTAFMIEATLADMLAKRMQAFAPQIIIGMPTLGLSLARAVAQRLGHKRYVALGTSRKFWYDADLSEPMNSITSPDQSKHLYLDPRMLPLLKHARIGLIDDVISSGTSITAGLRLLQKAALSPVVIGAAMLQTRRWEERMQQEYPTHTDRIMGVIETPLLRAASNGWHLADQFTAKSV